MMNIAHRGFSSKFPENTMLAYQKALDLGVKHIELDLQLTRDGHLVVMHDRTVDRTTNGKGRTVDLSLDEIKTLDAGKWLSPEFSGERIPTYAEVLAGLEPSVVLVTELKFEEDEGIQTVIDTIRNYDAADRVVISSFDLPKLPIVKALEPELPTTPLLKSDESSIQQRIDQTRALGAETIGPRCSDTTQELVDAAHDAGLLLRAWGLGKDQGEEMTRLIDLGIDGMTTDCPDILQQILSDRAML